MFILILSKNDAEKFNQERAFESLEQEKGICTYYHCPYDIERPYDDIVEDIDKYLKDLEKEELNSTSKRAIYIFREILDSAEIL